MSGWLLRRIGQAALVVLAMTVIVFVMRRGSMVVEHLAQHNHPWPVKQLDWPEAGHSIVFPTVPTTQLVYAHPVSGRLSTTGGHPAANAQADQASWAGVLDFLQQAVAAQAARTHP